MAEATIRLRNRVIDERRRQSTTSTEVAPSVFSWVQNGLSPPTAPPGPSAAKRRFVSTVNRGSCSRMPMDSIIPLWALQFPAKHALPALGAIA